MRWLALPFVFLLASCATTPPPEPPMSSSCVVDSYAHAAAFSAVAVDFDGTSDYLNRTGLDGVSDTKQVTGSFWINTDTDTGALQVVSATTATSFRFAVYIPSAAGDYLEIVGVNASNTVVVTLRSTDNTIKAASGWQHVMFSFDLTDSSKRHLYIDEVSSLTALVYTNSNIDIDGASTVWTIGAHGTSATNKLDGQLSELWLDFGTYIDLSVEANRRKFIDSAGKPVDLGDDGSTPTGLSPTICLNNPLATWQENNGTGGDFTENGALTAAASSPSD